MNKFTFYLIAIIILCYSCSTNNNFLTNSETLKNTYQVERIKHVNDWYFIYLSKGDSLFKVVSKKQDEPIEYRSKIKRHKRYQFTLKPIYPIKLTINGQEQDIISSFDMTFTLDSITYVSQEIGNGIVTIYSTPDLSGLYYLR